MSQFFNVACSPSTPPQPAPSGSCDSSFIGSTIFGSTSSLCSPLTDRTTVTMGRGAGEAVPQKLLSVAWLMACATVEVARASVDAARFSFVHACPGFLLLQRRRISVQILHPQPVDAASAPVLLYLLTRYTSAPVLLYLLTPYTCAPVLLYLLTPYTCAPFSCTC
jgi:hypothetical protein